MQPTSNQSDQALTAPNARMLRLTFGFVLVTSLVCSLYASFNARGLYSDAAALLVVIFEGKSFFVSGTRATVEILRQVPIVVLS